MRRALHPRSAPGSAPSPCCRPGENSGRGRSCPCGSPRRGHGRADRRFITAAGDETLRRGYFTCRRCGTHAHPLDDGLGVDGLVSPHVQRLLCIARTERTFEGASRPLRELAGLSICDTTVRKACDRHGGLTRARRRDDPEASQPIREADGDVEFQTDGTCVNTIGGWREVRLPIFAERRRSGPILDPDDWDDQRLPAPTSAPPTR